MKAITQDTYGSADALVCGTSDNPHQATTRSW
jgi:hypothetical protein